MSDTRRLPGGPAALVVAHPGHELRVHHWMELTRPVVFVLTDGSGHHGISRLHETTRILGATGARAGSIYGDLTDRALYTALMMGDNGLFQRLATRLADALVDNGCHLVATDAIEGYNPGHDICRHVTDAAVTLASARMGRLIASYDFLLVGRPDSQAPARGATPIRLTLDDRALDRKIAAARSYTEIMGDVESALDEHGREAFRLECLRPTVPVDLETSAGEPPFYEQHGERRVQTGQYRAVLRFTEHLRPIALALRALCAGVPQ